MKFAVKPPSISRHHADWLSLVEVSGPFVSLPVILRVFSDGLPRLEPALGKALRAAYETWQDNPAAPGQQRAWVLHVLTAVLGYPENLLAEGQSLPAGLSATLPEMGETLRPDLALVGPAGSDSAGQPQLLIAHYPAEQSLDKPVTGKHWKATPATRMMELLHGTNVPLGLVTNGEHWMLVYAPRGEVTGYASWYGNLWLDEPITLRAFHALLGVRRFFGVAADSTLLALLKESANDQQEVTDQLGYQVREAVEVLVQCFDALDQESQRHLLQGVQPAALYDAALTVMMRLVFLFSAEERGLLHLGKPLYDENYAVSTLQEQLQEVADQHGEEVLERRSDAWTRLLATFRAVHGGIQHQDLLMQAYGGSLFDPDRYPFLEGRPAGSAWRSTPAAPLSVNNRVVLHLLNALQRLRTKVGAGGTARGAAETRRVSFRALGVEQIGHVYEGLLDHTAYRASEVMLGIRGTRKKEPEIALATLEALLAKGEDALIELLKEETGRSAPALRRELNDGSPLDPHLLRRACGDDEALLARLRPFAGLIRDDSFERPWVVLPGSVFVTAGNARRSTGTHYTPPSLTEPIVRHTLEPLVYVGPAEGLPKEQWQLKSPKAILDLKVCDLAMGSGAFLVQACRYLAERLVEAWENEEQAHPGQVLVSPDGQFSAAAPSERLLPREAAERIAIARRVVADRCLYGVDINPMAVEMAKLSLWLITVDKTRPFTFLDHAFKCGDSLLGITALEQLENFSLRPGGGKQQAFGTLNLWRHIDEAKKKRELLEAMPSDTPEQVAAKAALYAEAKDAVAKLNAAADVLIALELKGLTGRTYENERESSADHMMLHWTKGLLELESYANQRLGVRHCLHWALEFPEIIQSGGFDAFIGNPPFMGGRQMPSTLGFAYTEPLRHIHNVEGPADLVCYFFRRSLELASTNNFSGLLATNSISETVNAAAGLRPILDRSGCIYRAIKNMEWPGAAAVTVSVVHYTTSRWQGICWLDGFPYEEIQLSLDPAASSEDPYSLGSTILYSQGTNVYGAAFIKSGGEIKEALQNNLGLKDYVRKYINGDVLNENPHLEGDLYAIDFGELDEGEIHGCDSILEELKSSVAYERRNQTRQVHESRPWLHWDKRTKFYAKARNQEIIYATVIVSSFFVVHAVSPKHLFAHGIELFLSDDPCVFAVLQSSMHEHWTRLTSGSLGKTTRYTASKCLETYPFPQKSRILELSVTGRHLLEMRTEIMHQEKIGSNSLYAKVHNPIDTSDIARDLRDAHSELDKAVAAAYGWQDLDLGHGFHETKQGLRFTVCETARREILDRLLELNHQRYAEEVAAGLHDKKAAKPARATKPGKAPAATPQGDLFAAPPVAAGTGEDSAILDYLKTHADWHSKDAILTACGFPENRWNVAIKELLESGQVERMGEKRGARYRAKSQGADK